MSRPLSNCLVTILVGQAIYDCNELKLRLESAFGLIPMRLFGPARISLLSYFDLLATTKAFRVRRGLMLAPLQHPLRR